MVGDGEEKKKVIISITGYYVLSERIDSNPPALPLEFELCSKSNTFTSAHLS